MSNGLLDTEKEMESESDRIYNDVLLLDQQETTPDVMGYDLSGFNLLSAHKLMQRLLDYKNYSKMWFVSVEQNTLTYGITLRIRRIVKF